MVYLRRLAAALTAELCLAATVSAFVPCNAAAQAMARVTVQSFGLSSDATQPQIGTPFHLLVTLRVREPVTRVDNLELPLLAQLDLLGDERSLQTTRAGTLYRETITVSARQAGDISIGPAVLQAVDPRDRRAKQYSTNGLMLHVVPAPGEPLRDSTRAAGAALASIFGALVWLFGIACVIALVVLLLRRRSKVVPVPVSYPPPPLPLPIVSPGDRLRDAYTVLAAERTRACAVRIRGVVREMVGASEKQTLGDVLARPAARDPAMRQLLCALERAAFTYDDDVSAAIEDACGALQRCIPT